MLASAISCSINLADNFGVLYLPSDLRIEALRSAGETYSPTSTVLSGFLFLITTSPPLALLPTFDSLLGDLGLNVSSVFEVDPD